MESTCSFPGCIRPKASKGLCQSHRRMQRLGQELRPIKHQNPSGTMCSGPACDNPGNQGGLCHGHRKQARRGQKLSPLKFRAPASMPLQDRLDHYTDKSGECWIWTGNKHPSGYGMLTWEGRPRYAHRLWFEQLHGQVAAGMDIDHMCRNPSCVNPAHLQAVSHKQNGENQTNLQDNNKSGVRGVTWDKSRNKWYASVKHNYKDHYVGRFDSLAEAEAAVVAKRNELFTNNLLDRAS